MLFLRRAPRDALSFIPMSCYLSPDLPSVTGAVADKFVCSIGTRTLVVRLDEKSVSEDVKSLALGIADWHSGLAPAGDSTVVFCDSAFGYDVAKMNLAGHPGAARVGKGAKLVAQAIWRNEPMHQHRRYKNPPIEEALCEFRFQPSQDWDLTIPGKLHARLNEEYSGRPREQRVVEAGLEIQGDQPSKLSLGEGLGKVQLVTEDGTRMVGVGPDVLSVHMLRPYQDPLQPGRGGWDEFRPRISVALDAYWEVAQPEGVHSIGLRYINRLVIPEKTVEVENYLRCALPVVSGLPDRLNNFMSRVEYAYSDGVRLVLSQGSIDAPSDHVGFLLDLDVIWENTQPITRSEALIKADDLRAREREAFETVITEKARELFDAD